jgi:hypothetical protein
MADKVFPLPRSAQHCYDMDVARQVMAECRATHHVHSRQLPHQKGVIHNPDSLRTANGTEQYQAHPGRSWNVPVFSGHRQSAHLWCKKDNL